MQRWQLLLTITLVAAVAAPQDSPRGGETVVYKDKLVDPEQFIEEIGRQLGLRTTGAPDKIDVTIGVVIPDKVVNVALARRLAPDERLKLDAIYAALPALAAEDFRNLAAKRQQRWKDRYAAAKTDAERLQVLAEHAGLADPR